MIILYYILIGILFSLFTDIVLYYMKDHPLVKNEVKQWGNFERIVCICLWPIASYVFFKAYIKTRFKK